MPLDDLLADREPDPGARVLARMEPLEGREDPLHVRALDSDAVVADEEPPSLRRALCANFHDRWTIDAELDGVVDEVLEDLKELWGVRLDGRERLMPDRGSGLISRDFEIHERLFQDLLAVGPLPLEFRRADAGEREQILNEHLHSLRSVDDETDELVGILVELPVVPLGEELRIARHHS